MTTSTLLERLSRTTRAAREQITRAARAAGGATRRLLHR